MALLAFASRQFAHTIVDIYARFIRMLQRGGFRRPRSEAPYISYILHQIPINSTIYCRHCVFWCSVLMAHGLGLESRGKHNFTIAASYHDDCCTPACLCVAIVTCPGGSAATL